MTEHHTVAPLLAPSQGHSLDYFRHVFNIARDNEKIDPDWPAITLSNLYLRGMKTAYAIALGAEAMGEFARNLPLRGAWKPKVPKEST